VLLALVAALALPAAEPGFAWAHRPPVIARSAAPLPEREVAAVVSVHAALDGPDLVVRFTFDRPVQRALYGSDGKPVSGRLRAVLYVDADDDRKTGLVAAANDPRSGADRRLEVGVVAVGADPEENLGASAVVTASLSDLAGKRRRSRWRGDATATPRQVVTGGKWVEVRLLAERGPWKRTSRLVLAEDDVFLEGRLRP
jgi:hypothetical protein